MKLIASFSLLCAVLAACFPASPAPTPFVTPTPEVLRVVTVTASPCLNGRDAPDVKGGAVVRCVPDGTELALVDCLERYAPWCYANALDTPGIDEMWFFTCEDGRVYVSPCPVFEE